MPSDPPAAPEPEPPPMIQLIAIAKDGQSQRLRFATEAEARAAAGRLRATGHSLYWLAWSETLRRTVSIPED